MTTLYCPNPLPDSFGLCEQHSLRPARMAAPMYGIELKGDEDTNGLIALIEAARATMGRTDTLFRSFEGECEHCRTNMERESA